MIADVPGLGYAGRLDRIWHEHGPDVLGSLSRGCNVLKEQMGGSQGVARISVRCEDGCLAGVFCHGTEGGHWLGSSGFRVARGRPSRGHVSCQFWRGRKSFCLCAAGAITKVGWLARDCALSGSGELGTSLGKTKVFCVHVISANRFQNDRMVNSQTGFAGGCQHVGS